MKSNKSKISCKRVKSKCHPEFISGSHPFKKVEEMLNRVQHDKEMGFTLIELLVVVLIIGILAAVAVPQYQRAVVRARLSEAPVYFSALSKAIDVYLLENGYPDSITWFTGENNKSSYLSGTLDISVEWPSCDNEASCFTQGGMWTSYCDATRCVIAFYPGRKPDGTRDGAMGTTLRWFKNAQSQGWYINLYAGKKISCLWAKDTYGINFMDEESRNKCKEVGVE